MRTHRNSSDKGHHTILNRHRAALALAACCALGAGQAMAASGTWLAEPANGAWDNPANWVDGIIPGDNQGDKRNAGSTTFDGPQAVTFNSSTVSTVEPDLNRRVQVITFSPSAGDYTVGATTASNPLYIGGITGGSGAKTFTFNSHIQTIQDATLNANTGQVFDFNSRYASMAGLVTNLNGTGTYNFNAGLTSSGSGGTATFRLGNSSTINVDAATAANHRAVFEINGTNTLNLNAAGIISAPTNASNTLTTGGAGIINVNAADAITGTAGPAIGKTSTGTAAAMTINHAQSYTGRMSVASATNTDGARRTAGYGQGTLIGNISNYDADGGGNQYNSIAIIGANGYTVATASSATGTLLVNNATGSGTGNSDVNVVTGTLGGNGFIVNSDVEIQMPSLIAAGNPITYTPTIFEQGVTLHKRQRVSAFPVADGTFLPEDFNTLTPGNLESEGFAASGAATYGKLSPGASAGAIGTLTMDLGSKGLNIAYAVEDANTQTLLFDLDSIANSDQVALLNDTVLNIGTAGLEFDDFVFTALGGFGPGVYTLFDTSSAINGTLGANLSGLIGDLTSTIGFGDGGRDIVLTVVPEPTSLAGLGLAAFGLLARRRRFV